MQERSDETQPAAVLSLYCNGKTQKQIATKLKISQSTVSCTTGGQSQNQGHKNFDTRGLY